MARRSLDENRSRQVSNLTLAEKEIMLDNFWYERRDESTLNEKTLEPKFHKALVVLFKKTEGIDRTDKIRPSFYRHTSSRCTSRYSLPHIAITGHNDTRRRTQKFGRSERQTYHTWHLLVEEPLAQVAQRSKILFPIFLKNISSFWLPNLAQVEGN